MSREDVGVRAIHYQITIPSKTLLSFRIMSANTAYLLKYLYIDTCNVYNKSNLHLINPVTKSLGNIHTPC